MAGGHLNALSPVELARRMNQFQLVFPRRDTGQSIAAVGWCQLIEWMIKNEDPGPHRAVKDAANDERLTDAAGSLELQGVAATARHRRVEGGNVARGLDVVRGRIAVRKGERIAHPNRHRLRRELEVFLVNHRLAGEGRRLALESLAAYRDDRFREFASLGVFDVIPRIPPGALGICLVANDPLDD